MIESDVKYKGGVSDSFCVSGLVRQECVFVPFFHHFHSNVVAQSRWEASVGSIAFADNAVLLEECQNVLTKVNP